VNGQNARLLDAFAFAQYPFGNDQLISLKLGRQTLIWGQKRVLCDKWHFRGHGADRRNHSAKSAQSADPAGITAGCSITGR
jgi:hypothetical protein